jgi:adenylate cyclase
MTKKKIRFDFFIPLTAAVVFAALNLFTFFQNGENRIYDQYLHIKPAVPEHESMLLLNIDDLAIAKVGTFPWSRSTLADGLIRMREFDAAYAIFDIEFTEDSPLGVNTELLEQEIPEYFEEEFLYIQENIVALFQALQSGNISLADAEVFVEDLTGLTEAAKIQLLEKIREIVRDHDIYFGKTTRFFGDTFHTVNMLPYEDEDVSAKLKAWVRENLSLQNIEVEGYAGTTEVDIRPTILPIVRHAEGVGFPNIIIDDDGVRRRVDLVTEVDGAYYPQLAFAPLLDWLGYPAMTITENNILLEEARFPDGTVEDIRIPLDENGHMLLNWPKKDFDNSFRSLSYYYLVLHDRQEEDLVHNMNIMDEAGFLSGYRGNSGGLLDSYRYAESLEQELLDGGDLTLIDEYKEVRTFFFDEVGSFLSGPAEEDLKSQIDAALASGELPEEYVEQYEQIRSDVETVFSASREIYRNLVITRERLAEELPGSFCVIGWTGTGTTDRGVNPFDETYDNVGTHATAANTVINRRFLDFLPWWYGAAAGLVFAFATFLIIRNRKPGISIILGVGMVILIGAAGILIFYFTGLYVPILTPFLATAVTLIVLTVVQFLQTYRERTFIRNAFSHYLSSDVINEIMQDPDKLSLGGEKRKMTAVFTDIKGFSSISENMDPTDLVKLLNTYLTEMSNIMLSQKGTIDKYEGDAIISFFGAPLDLEDHAVRACRSAIRMKKAEALLNEHIMANKMSPLPLRTRIGINTGWMVVGNMGTAEKMDYTIMGNAVNLASRLEGVNTFYGSWKLMSEYTYNAGGNQFVTRKLDRVRVVGIKQPVRLYELIDEPDAISDEEMDRVNKYHEVLELFEKKRWEDARDGFEELKDENLEDGTILSYIRRCNEKIKEKSKKKKDDDDGIVELREKK